MAIKLGIDTREQQTTGVADKPKALPYFLKVNLRKLDEKGAPGPHKCFFSPILKQHLSEISVGKIFSCTVHHHIIEKKFLSGFQINFERDVKKVVQINQFTG